MSDYLCMKPVKLTVGGSDVTLPKDVLYILAVYRTKTAARKVHGRNVPLVEVEPDDPKAGHWEKLEAKEQPHD